LHFKHSAYLHLCFLSARTVRGIRGQKTSYDDMRFTISPELSSNIRSNFRILPRLDRLGGFALE
jgi:hypothetical protein